MAAEYKLLLYDNDLLVSIELRPAWHEPCDIFYCPCASYLYEINIFWRLRYRKGHVHRISQIMHSEIFRHVSNGWAVGLGVY